MPEKEEYRLYGYEDEGYFIQCALPGRRAGAVFTNQPDDVRIDGKKAFPVSELVIDFQKDSFDRAEPSKDEPSGEVPLRDPPLELVKRAIESLLTRLRFAARSHHVPLSEFPKGQWSIRYLNDDFSEFDHEEGQMRGVFGKSLSVTTLALSPSLWDEIHRLPVDFEIPPWEELLYDAESQLTSTGAAVALAACALEVFIAIVLDQLAQRQSLELQELYSWISDRKDHQKDPAVREQFDELLLWLAGHSLKTEKPDLWQSMVNTRNARNYFMHNGVPSIDKGKTVLTYQQAKALVRDARRTILAVREWIPEELQWPQINVTVKIELSKALLEPAPQSQDKDPKQPDDEAKG